MVRVLTGANVLAWNSCCAAQRGTDLHFYVICSKIYHQTVWIWHSWGRKGGGGGPCVALTYLRLLRLYIHFELSLAFKWMCMKQKKATRVNNVQSLPPCAPYSERIRNDEWCGGLMIFIVGKQVLKQAHWVLTTERWRQTSARRLQHPRKASTSIKGVMGEVTRNFKGEVRCAGAPKPPPPPRHPPTATTETFSSLLQTCPSCRVEHAGCPRGVVAIFPLL